MVSAKFVTLASVASSYVVASDIVERDNAIMDGVNGSITNTRQVIQTLTHQLQSNDGHPASDVIAAVITGLDSQIDNGIATISSALAPLTGGLSQLVGNALLGSFAQSVTNGAEVVLSNLIGEPLDLVSQGIRGAFANTLSNFATHASQYNVNTDRLSQIANQIRTLSATHPSGHASNHHKRDNAIMDGVNGSITNTRQVIQTLTHQLQSNDGHPASDVIAAVITGLDSQIDNGIATISSALAPLTGGLSQLVGNALLGSFAQSVTNGAEVVLSNLIGEPLDLVSQGIRGAFANTLSNFATHASQYNVNTDRLSQIANQIRTLSATHPSGHASNHHKRDNAIMDGVNGSITNTRQVIQTLTHQLQSNDGHPASDVIAAVITGLDSQIDNGIATISNALAPLTGGLSQLVGNALLGSFAQAVTNGAEVVLSNLIGEPLDLVSQGLRGAFANSLATVAKAGAQYNVNTERLSQISKQIANLGKH